MSDSSLSAGFSRAFVRYAGSFVRIPICAALIGCASVPVAEMEPDPNGCVDRIRVHEGSWRAGGFPLTIESLCHVPLTLHVYLELENLGADRNLPIRISLEPGEEAPLVTLYPIEGRRRGSYAWSTRFIVGRDSVEHDESARYVFPFGGSEPRACAQGSDGSVSHINSYGIDFEMPVGTPVLAARAGIVYRIFDGFGEGRFDREALERSNTVFVLHEDSTLATYGTCGAASRFRRETSSSRASCSASAETPATPAGLTYTSTWRFRSSPATAASRFASSVRSSRSRGRRMGPRRR